MGAAGRRGFSIVERTRFCERLDHLAAVANMHRSSSEGALSFAPGLLYLGSKVSSD
jgi:hypothetical protein